MSSIRCRIRVIGCRWPGRARGQGRAIHLAAQLPREERGEEQQRERTYSPRADVTIDQWLEAMRAFGDFQRTPPGSTRGMPTPVMASVNVPVAVFEVVATVRVDAPPANPTREVAMSSTLLPPPRLDIVPELIERCDRCAAAAKLIVHLVGDLLQRQRAFGQIDLQRQLAAGVGQRQVQLHLVDQVQDVYRSQGVSIHDKHIEIIIRQMLRRLKEHYNGRPSP